MGHEKKYIKYSPWNAICDHKLGEIIHLENGKILVLFSDLSKSEYYRVFSYIWRRLGRVKYSLDLDTINDYEPCVVLLPKWGVCASLYNTKDSTLFGIALSLDLDEDEITEKSIHILYQYVNAHSL